MEFSNKANWATIADGLLQDSQVLAVPRRLSQNGDGQNTKVPHARHLHPRAAPQKIGAGLPHFFCLASFSPFFFNQPIFLFAEALVLEDGDSLISSELRSIPSVATEINEFFSKFE